MSSSEIRRSPMFPLGTPLLPGTVLPLLVFEPRYRTMMDDVIGSGEAEFGVVLIERGREVGGGDVRSTVGTMARMVRHEELEDGRRAVVVIGDRRIKVEEWLADDPYPIAMIVDWPDVESYEPTDELEASLGHSVDRFVELLRRVDDRTPAVEHRFGPESVDEYVHRVMSTLPVGPVDRQRVLAASDSARRLSIAIDAVDDLEAILRFRLGVDDSER